MVEGWHSKITNGIHESIWAFCLLIQQEEESNRMNVSSIDMGLTVKKQALRYKSKNDAISKLYERLEKSSITVDDFLMKITNFVSSLKK